MDLYLKTYECSSAFGFFKSCHFEARRRPFRMPGCKIKKNL